MVNRKLLWLAPLSALLAGSHVEVPALKSPLPEHHETGCDYEAASALYLRAYAYAQENQGTARAMLEKAAAELSLCQGKVPELQSRIEELEGKLEAAPRILSP